MLSAIGCVRFDAPRFDFDSSLLVPESRQEFAAFAAMRRDNPEAPPSVFGHADPTGDDDYNKKLSGRRARAVFATLIRDTATWEDLYSNAQGGDKWGTRSVQVMLQALKAQDGQPFLSGGTSAATDQAVRKFQRENGLAVDGDAGPATRKKLFLAYMTFLCTGDDGALLALERKDFLARVADPDGKGDLQGCGEFNPVLVFSKQENDDFNRASDKSQRDAQNGPNRRVVIFLFEPGSLVTPSEWPCPTVAGGVAGCKKRFWSDGETRRSNQAVRRQYGKTQDTFACRFYQRLAMFSPCEAPGVLTIELLYEDQTPMADADFEAVFGDGSSFTGRTDARGRAVIDAAEGSGPFKLFLRSFPESFVDADPPAAGAPPTAVASAAGDGGGGGGDDADNGTVGLWPNGAVG